MTELVQAPLRARNLFLRNFLWILIPATIALVLLYLRPTLIDTKCGHSPEICVKSSVPWPDAMVVGLDNPRADEASYFTQNLSGVLAIFLPLALIFFHFRTFSITFKKWGSYLVTFLQAVALNFAVNEVVRSVVQRPRPFVFASPLSHGTNTANYSSFYSGHVSFSAVALATFVFFCLRMNFPKKWFLTLSFLSLILVFLTGLFRVLSGRHFITDVLVGGILGIALAYFTHRRYLKAQL